MKFSEYVQTSRQMFLIVLPYFFFESQFVNFLVDILDMLINMKYKIIFN